MFHISLFTNFHHLSMPLYNHQSLFFLQTNRCQVLGVRCQVLGVRCQVLGVRCQVLGLRCQVLGLIAVFKLMNYIIISLLWSTNMKTPVGVLKGGRGTREYQFKGKRFLITDYPDAMLWRLLGNSWEVLCDRSGLRILPPNISIGFCQVSRALPYLRNLSYVLIISNKKTPILC